MKKGRGTSLRRRATTSILKRDCSRQFRPPGAWATIVSAIPRLTHEPYFPGDSAVTRIPAGGFARNENGQDFAACPLCGSWGGLLIRLPRPD
jgi:hypothetical protein